MKWIKYKLCSGEINRGTEENPDIEPILHEKSMEWSKASEEIAKREAHNGEYTIEEDGQAEPEPVETEEAKRIRELEEVLNALLGVSA